MKKMNIEHWLLTAVICVTMVYLFFIQIRYISESGRIAVVPPHIAYGYSGVTFSGTVYHDEGATAVGTGTGVALYINGVPTSTTTTTAGAFSFTGLTVNTDDVLTAYVDGESEYGALVMKVNESEIRDQLMTGMNIYEDRLILRTSTASTLKMTTMNLDVANGGGDPDLASVYNFSRGSGTLVLGKDKELFIWKTTTHTTSGSIFTHDLDVKGTLTMAAGADITASGSFVAGGTLTTTGNIYLTSVDSGETLQVNGSSLNNVYIDNGLVAYFRMDEGAGTNASGSTLSIQTGATLSGDASWTRANTGTTLFFNPFAIEFDGDGDSLTFGDAFDLSTNMQRTFSGWFRRKSATTEDTIFAKKSGSGAASAGYMLYIDDESDQLVFEMADGSNTYSVTSDTAITDQNWHHFAVSVHTKDNNRTNIFLDGAIDVSAKSGSMNPASNSTANAVSFRIGDTNSGTSGFDGTLDDFRIYSRALTGSEIVHLAAGNKATGSGTYVQRSALDINGDFGIYSGTLDTGTGYALQFAGDVSAYGELRTNSGTVTLNGTDQTLRGSSAFNQIAKTTSTEITLTFESHTQQTVSGALTLKGATNQQLNIRASVTGRESYIAQEFSGATILKFLDVKDSNAGSGETLYCTLGCINSGNNTNWVFEGDCGDGVVNTGEQCDDGNSNNADNCPNDCQLAVCGDNVVEGLEECEPPGVGSCQSNCIYLGSAGGGAGRTSSAASSASYYQYPDPPDGCGDAIVDTNLGEECDEGRYNTLGTCSYDCKLLRCGDGIISPQIGEDCEPEIVNTVNGAVTYRVPTCGEVCTAPESTAQGTVHDGCKRIFLPVCESSSSSVQTTNKARCGNGVVNAGEECDFGGTCVGGSFDGSFWTDSVSAKTCITGGGVPQPTSGDGCDASCKTEFCGDGIVQARGNDNQPDTADDEQCDNGSICSNNASAFCKKDSDCSDGGTCEYFVSKDSTCSALCKLGGASAAVSSAKQSVQPASSAASSQQRTPSAPVDAVCGNGTVEGGEECDAGEQNSDVNPGACRTSCTFAQCGDYVVDLGEQCDNGTGNSDVYPDSCRSNCQLPYCGDGIRDSGEECDGGLSCTSVCTVLLSEKQCGNGIQEQGEQCDDGNSVAGDGCNPLCMREVDQKPVKKVQGVLVQEHTATGSTEEENARIASLVLEADVIVINPTEYANALVFTEGESASCATLLVKGKGAKAAVIRDAAFAQQIPIMRDIPLARSIYASVQPGQPVSDPKDCKGVEALYKELHPVLPAAPEEPAEQTEITEVEIPVEPTTHVVPQYPLAQLVPMVSGKAPVGETGPAAAAVLGSGVAAGVSWIRRRAKRG